jgi:1-acyl-sn-glycerol-3-phosphate acyltransferase
MRFSFLFVVTVTLLSIPAAIIFIPLALITGNVEPLYKVGTHIARAGLWMARVRVETEGLDGIPAHTACIFMANHVSNLDPPALLPVLPSRTSAFLKSSLMNIPALGYAMKLAKFVPVDRTGRLESARNSENAAQEVLKSGIHITTFVEGTRSKDGRMLPFKKGPFYLAMASGAPCIPISIWGTETMMPKGSARIHPGTAHIIFHPPLYPRDFASREELRKAVRGTIASGLPEWMRETETKPNGLGHQAV